MKQTLGELAKAYAQGDVSKEDYRKLRNELIQGIVAEDIAVKEIDFLPPLKPFEEVSITQKIVNKDTTQINPQPPSASNSPPASPVQAQQQPTPKTNSFWFIMIGTIAIILMIVGIILFYTQSITKPQTENNAIINTNAETITNTAGEHLITKFLTAKNWNDDSLEQFITAWSALPTEDQDATAKTKRMQRLHRAIYDQFLEAKALAGINSERAILKQQSLISFANQIGIDDSRFRLD